VWCTVWDMHDSMNGLSVQQEEEFDKEDMLPGKSDTKSLPGNPNSLDSMTEMAKTGEFLIFLVL
jgi:hypothetical protein